MKKTLIALALTALPVAAMADVVLYGQVKAGVEISKFKNKNGSSNEKSSTATEIADFGSRIGFKGKENLADGLDAIWQVESRVSVDGNKNRGFGTRDSFIGLEGGFGKVRAGYISTPLNNMGTIDNWEYDNNALGLGIFTRTGSRVVSARYDTPSFGGFSASVQYTPRDNANPSDKYTKEVAGRDAYYAGLNFANSGVFAQYGFGFKKNNVERAANTYAKGKDGYAHRLEAGYDANNLFVGLGAQYTKNWDTAGSYAKAVYNDDNAVVTGGSADAGVKTLEAAATVGYRFGNVTPKLSYAHGWKAKASEGGEKLNGSQYKQVVLGADYDFSKRTTAFAQAGWLKTGSGDNKRDETAGLVGLRHKF
ncbi:trimeric porin PorB [Neisseria leonii]|uniref:trimeric porin PorB n=1 Tax=Neisseria leonii TaxID=2995413 RepID=UPI00237BA3F3|nr:trimeric porin PorB [Neisseria sp. 3986]MDD9326694.1 trimeric porin PorB [Neisseria sp. 3986]